MRITLVNPPVPAGRFTNRDLMGGMGIDDDFGVGLGPRFVALLKNEGTRLPVISLAFAAALLADHDVTVLDQSGLDPADPAALDAVVRSRPEWIVAASSFAFLGAELRYLERARAATGARRMLLNQAATFFADDILRRGLAEAISRGDPEVLVGHLARGTLAPGRDGVLMADPADGRPVPALSGFVADLDTLPEPRWDAFPRDQYGYFPLLKKRPFLTMLSSRGCPYQCHFCPYPVAQGAPFRPRSAALVVDEMQRLVERFGVRSVLFRDPTFSLDLKRVKDLCRLVIARGLPLEWGIETRLDRMDEEMLALLGRAGCRSAEFGMDPIDEHTRLASHRKGIKPARAAELIRVMEANGIATAGLFVVGIPEQSEDEMLRTLDWVETLEISYMNYEVATPFPGTELYTQAVQKGWTKPITLDDLLDGDPKLSFNGVIDLARMKALQDRALSRFYLRPRKIAREIFNQDFVENVRFMSASGLKFIRGGLKA
jgi:radical SAM superfamily enzyme YgiQ (UPF0313 family)